MTDCLAHPGSVDHIRGQGADADLGFTRPVDGHPRRGAEGAVLAPQVIGPQHVGYALDLAPDDELRDGPLALVEREPDEGVEIGVLLRCRCDRSGFSSTGASMGAPEPQHDVLGRHGIGAEVLTVVGWQPGQP